MFTWVYVVLKCVLYHPPFRIISIYMTLGDISICPIPVSLIANCTVLITQGIIEFGGTRSYHAHGCYMMKEL